MILHKLASVQPGKTVRNWVDSYMREHPRWRQVDRVRLCYDSISDLDCAKKAVTVGLGFDINLILNGCGSPAAICDLGANSGFFPLLIYNLTGVKPSGICVEAGYDSFRKTLRNLQANTMPIVTIHGMVGEESGTVFHVNESSMSSGTIRQDWAYTSYVKTESPPALDIAALWRGRRGDILKIDIEGSEYGLFKNTASAFFDCFDFIAVEWHEPLCYLSDIRNALPNHALIKCNYESGTIGYAYFKKNDHAKKTGNRHQGTHTQVPSATGASWDSIHDAPEVGASGDTARHH